MAPDTIAQFTATRLDGAEQPLADYLGNVVLVVNTASECGLTPQYEGLEQLWRAHRDEGFVVLGFPCNQFGNQEPGDESQIAEFCDARFGVSFPMFAKVDVNGDGAHPLWQWLRSQKSGVLGGRIKWNFTKFLLDRDGVVVRRYAPTTTPETIEQDVRELLSE